MLPSNTKTATRQLTSAISRLVEGHRLQPVLREFLFDPLWIEKSLEIASNSRLAAPRNSWTSLWIDLHSVFYSRGAELFSKIFLYQVECLECAWLSLSSWHSDLIWCCERDWGGIGIDYFSCESIREVVFAIKMNVFVHFVRGLLEPAVWQLLQWIWSLEALT